MNEAEIENAVVAYAESLGAIAVKLRVDGENGFPDRTIIGPAGVLFIEFKTPRGRLRPMQRVWIERLTSQGHQVEVVSSVARGCEIVDRFLG